MKKSKSDHKKNLQQQRISHCDNLVENDNQESFNEKQRMKTQNYFSDIQERKASCEEIHEFFQRFEELGIPVEETMQLQVLLNGSDESKMSKASKKQKNGQGSKNKFKLRSFLPSLSVDTQPLPSIYQESQIHSQVVELKQKCSIMKEENSSLKKEIQEFQKQMKSVFLNFSNQLRNSTNFSMSLCKKTQDYDQKQNLKSKIKKLEHQKCILMNENEQLKLSSHQDLNSKQELTSQLKKSIELVEEENNDLKYELSKSEYELKKGKRYEQEILELNCTLQNNFEYIFDLEQKLSRNEAEIEEKTSEAKGKLMVQFEREKENMKTAYQEEFEAIKLILRNQIFTQMQDQRDEEKQNLHLQYLHQLALSNSQKAALQAKNQELSSEIKQLIETCKSKLNKTDIKLIQENRELRQKYEQIQQQLNSIKQNKKKDQNLSSSNKNMNIEITKIHKIENNDQSKCLTTIEFHAISNLATSRDQKDQNLKKQLYASVKQQNFDHFVNDLNGEANSKFLQNARNQREQRRFSNSNLKDDSITRLIQKIKSQNYNQERKKRILSSNEVRNHPHNYASVESMESSSVTPGKSKVQRIFNNYEKKSFSPSSTSSLRWQDREHQNKFRRISNKLESLRSDFRREVLSSQ